VVAGAGEPVDYTWSVTADNEIAGTIFAISGADTTNPIAAQVHDNNGLPNTLSLVTPVADTFLILWGGSDSTGPQSWSNPDGMTEHFDETVTATWLSHAGYTGPSGPAGPYTRTLEGTAGASPLGWFVAIRPLAGPPPAAVPEVTSFAPLSGPVAELVTVTGDGFSGATEVLFGGVAASNFTVNSNTQISAYVPSGAATGPITVTNPEGSDASLSDYAVAAHPAVLVGAGDIADCAIVDDEATALLLDTIPGEVFTLGDNAYPDGSFNDYTNCYGPNWGRHKERTRPATGNHEYATAGAAGHFTYYGSSAGAPGEGWYSYDVGDWHVIVLNSNCSQVGGCETTSAQGQWLEADLIANSSACTLAYWHHPRFSSGDDGTVLVADFWSLLYDHGADVVLSAHDHVYERFARQNPDGVADPTGIRQFTVGTGGKPLNPFAVIHPNSEMRNNSDKGVLKLSLNTGGYDWEFVPIAGDTFTDTGSAGC
jgi:uncharacterized protein (TIGR03437 family)